MKKIILLAAGFLMAGTVANAQTSPLANTLRFGLLFNFGDKKIVKK